MILQANAKINLGLRIIGKRTDGYHDLETVFYEIPWADEIELQPSATVSMTSDAENAPADESNLCMKAATLLRKTTGTENGVSITLKKNIPIGAGLGGGSSDAAAVLRGLNSLWNLHLSNEKLRTLAATLGADVAFFIEGGSAYATGKGEILEYFSFSLPYWLVVAVPPVHVSTATAYGNLKQKSGYGRQKLQSTVVEQIHQMKSFSQEVVNDFEASVFETFPIIKETKELFIASGATFALMSGSGSSVFGFFEQEERAYQAMSKFDSSYHIFCHAPKKGAA